MEDRRSILETFPNPHPGRDYVIEHKVQEFTSLCPITGQPDFARMVIRYVAAGKCVELKSLKMYLQSFRNEGIFYEDVTNLILNDLVSACSPKWMSVRSIWSVRGGIRSVVTAEHGNRPQPLSS
ncbi:MAG: NADPH-dependent 7-cyano-7-deazaguanine reductase QueF [Phycisphaerales bacterium]|nr:MAG: NADPH-dependent 7-cyano-7-deazaguanine reductase QueF [Phycisphaerales bacterium]